MKIIHEKNPTTKIVDVSAGVVFKRAINSEYVYIKFKHPPNMCVEDSSTIPAICLATGELCHINVNERVILYIDAELYLKPKND